MADNEQSETEALNEAGPGVATEPSGYVANFEGDEIDGVTYSLGDRIADGLDPGTIAYLVKNGRITPVTDAVAESPSGGESPIHGGKAPAGDSGPKLTDEQQAEADKLANKSKDELLAIAKDEGVDGVTEDNNKAEIAAKIVAARSA